MGSAMRAAMFKAFQLRLSNLGSTLTPGQIYMLVDDAETVIAANANAQADSIEDNIEAPDPPQGS